jgi:three-Cys-motif partner protein
MDGHLFPPDEPQMTLKEQPRKPEPKRHLEVVRPRLVNPQVQMMEDGAGQADARDGLPARFVSPHSLKKAWMVKQYLGTVGRAMARKWWEVNYVELFSGPGMLIDRNHGDELPGSPLEALAIECPFERYVFCDGHPDYSAAVTERMTKSPSSRVEVFPGDANDHEHLERVASMLDPRALVLLYLDPAKPNLNFSTIEFFVDRFEHLDLIINLPFMNIYRSLSVNCTEGSARFLNHPDPLQLRYDDPFSASRAIRKHFLGELRAIGLKHIEQEEVWTSKAPFYDIILASREEKAKTLWKRANRVKFDGQVGLDLSPE